MHISVIIPTYNRQKILSRCLAALCSQTYPHPFEIIIVNDGGKDHTEEFVREKQSHHKNISYYFKENGGASSARNYGVKKAKGKIIAFVDDDCIPNPSWLENIARSFRDSKILVVQGNITYPKTKNPFIYTSKIVNEIAADIRIKNDIALFIGTGNYAIRKSFLEKHALFLDEFLVTREDEDLFRRIDKLSTVHYIENPVLHFCSSSWRKDKQRFYGYGYGEYHLQQKWGKTNRLNYDLSFWRLYRDYGFITYFIVRVVSLFRRKNFRMGYQQAQIHRGKINS